LAPALFLFLGTSVLLAELCAPRDEVRLARTSILVSACYGGNLDWCFKDYWRPLRHTWSLAVEEHFYLVWPLILWGLLRLRSRRCLVVGLLVGGIAISAVCRLRLVPVWGFGAATKLLFGRADALLCGCLLAFMATWGWL